MKTILTLILALSIGVVTAQQKYLTKNGEITFEASVPSFEEVKAKSNSVTAILNTETGDIAALALIKGFRFKNALMEEHFNENYIESDEFPKAKFKGTLVDFDAKDLKSNYTIKGALTLHGVTKEISVKATVNKTGDSINLSANFSTQPEDFDIKIPSIVSKKIADDIQVQLNFELNPK